MLKIARFRARKAARENKAGGTRAAWRPWHVLGPLRRLGWLFWLVVGLPTTVAVVYFLFMASDIYVSEASYVIKQSDNKQSATMLGAFLETAGITTAKEDVFTVREFMLSRDALRILENNLGISKLYSSKDIDFIKRFNPFGFKSGFESLFEYYQRMVSIEFDTSAAICTLKVKAFRPEVARDISEALLFLGEGFVNELNDRARRDMINFSTQEVEMAEAASTAASLALSEYRSRQTLFDPSQQSMMQWQQISKMQTDLIEVRGQLAQLRTFAADTPYIKALEKRNAELGKEIAAATAKITGGSDSMVKKITEYERLSIDHQYLEKRLVVALGSLQQARSDAQRQRMYLAPISKPSLPDEAFLPQRLFDILITCIGSLMVYGTLRMLIAGTKEHRA
jgi:capsular polysaccharide transport system permease protein